ncbi:hypothetical protein PF001_g6107, partial [Phytophthora fragariae]
MHAQVPQSVSSLAETPALRFLTGAHDGRRNSFVDHLRDELTEIETTDTYKRERVIMSPQGAEISVGGDAVLNFCANNYLGLSHNPAVEQAAADTLKERGFGLSSGHDRVPVVLRRQRRTLRGRDQQ